MNLNKILADIEARPRLGQAPKPDLFAEVNSGDTVMVFHEPDGCTSDSEFVYFTNTVIEGVYGDFMRTAYGAFSRKNGASVLPESSRHIRPYSYEEEQAQKTKNRLRRKDGRDARK
jgi:hypothetical protein